MKSSNQFLKLSSVLFIVCMALSVFAHDAWVVPGAGPVYQILYGHKIPEAYSADKITVLKVLDANQKSVSYNRIVTKEGVSVKVISGKPALFVLDFDNGYWVKSGAESHNISKAQIPAGSDPLHAIKFSKTMISWQSWMSQPQGQRIEFIPVDVTEIPKAGARLRLQLLLDGKPLANQMVENNSNEQGPKTDRDGYVTVTVTKGMNRFATDHDMAQTNNEIAKRLSLTAVFVFNAK